VITVTNRENTHTVKNRGPTKAGASRLQISPKWKFRNTDFVDFVDTFILKIFVIFPSSEFSQ
jgi:hypothetical protein